MDVAAVPIRWSTQGTHDQTSSPTSLLWHVAGLQGIAAGLLRQSLRRLTLNVGLRASDHARRLRELYSCVELVLRKSVGLRHVGELAVVAVASQVQRASCVDLRQL